MNRERTRMRDNVETFFVARGFRKETLSLLSYDNLMKLAKDYHYIKENKKS
ncbi:hypothetical protein [Cytobacillus horneckiae]|uniref:hypothetical protein n=1 Tax=Cytobacillus horneckiae TaxID=549687 RepID=UPI003D1D5002